MGKNKYGKQYKGKGQNLKGSSRSQGAIIKGGKMKASHILVEKFSKAQQIYEDIQSGTDFEQLARENSNCPSKKRGGNLGDFGKNDMVPEFWSATAKLNIGEISQPVKSKYGYHIIKRTG
jgi:peptidyl-prolyl cis-trans isomerase C